MNITNNNSIRLPLQQSPSDPNLQVIEFKYQHVGRREVWTGKLVVLLPEYRWLLSLDDNPRAYGELWEDFNDSAVVIEYVDTTLGKTVEGALISMLSPDSDGFHLVVTDTLIEQLTHKQLHTLWVATSNEGLELPQSVDKTALNRTLRYAVSLRKLEAMAAKAIRVYHTGLTESLDPDTL
jgi:hypothetical protein